jgi:foldase protein PrsA
MVARSVLGWMRRGRLLPLLCMALLAATLAGCGANAASDPLLAAKVNGHAITLAQYQQMLAVYRATNARNNFFTDWRNSTQRTDLATTQQQVLDILINIELLRDQLRQQHITVSQKAIQTARNTLTSQIAADRKQLEQNPDPALKALLDTITPDVIDMLSEQEAMRAIMQEKGKAPAVHLRGIEVKDQQTARDLQQKAQSGSDFATLARENSLNKTTGDLGGELGTFFVGQITAEFDKEVFVPGAHPGKYLTLLLQGNYWLFELTDLGPHAISSISDTQTQTNTVTSWLQIVVRPGASVEEYVTIG